MLSVQDYISIDDDMDLPQKPKQLNSLTTSMRYVEIERKSYAIPLICLIVILQNICDFSVAANMVWLASLVGNSTSTWLPACKDSKMTSSVMKFSQPSTAEGSIATLSYYLLIAAFSIVGGCLGDTKLGRYKTLKLSLLLMIIGTTLYATLAIILERNDRSYPYKVQKIIGTMGYNALTYILLIISIVICAAGSGIHSANIIPFGIEQFLNTENESGQEPDMTLSKVFHLLYFVRNLGCCLTFIFIAALQEYQWILGFCAPLLCAVVSSIPLLIGKKYFVVNVPRVNMTSLFFSVIKEGYKLSKVPSTQPDPTVHFLDLAKKDFGGSFRREDVNAVKSLLRLIPMLSIYMVYFILYSQMHTTFYIQGLFMKTPQFFPYAGAEAVDNVTIMLIIPLVVFVIYPYYRARYGVMSPFVKTQIGFALIALSMLVAGIVEYFRILHSDPSYNEAIKVRLHFYSLLDLNVVQSLQFYMRFPQYILVAISEVFVVIVGLKVAYFEAPKYFKSAAMGIFYMFNALGTFLAAVILLLIQVITYYLNGHKGWICQDLNVGQMYYYFYVISGVMIINMIFLCFKAKKFESQLKN